MRIAAIDPGTTHSALLFCEVSRGHLPDIDSADIEPNDAVLRAIRELIASRGCDAVWVEDIQSFGMPVGSEVFETVRYTGRIQQLAAERSVRVSFYKRTEIKLALCKSTRAKDPSVRVALLDLYGGKQKAIGRKKTPGPLYAIRSHLWSALAVAVCGAAFAAMLDPTRLALPRGES